jgi:(S)-ureidoglycine aminohydrolase
MPVQQTAKGETRQIFSLTTPWLSRIDLHATTLNPGEVSHPPHTHRAEEIILMRTGHVEEYINGKHCPATDGDLIFLPSGSLHAVENHGTERCQYFALQWQP